MQHRKVLTNLLQKKKKHENVQFRASILLMLVKLTISVIQSTNAQFYALYRGGPLISFCAKGEDVT